MRILSDKDIPGEFTIASRTSYIKEYPLTENNKIPEGEACPETEEVYSLILITNSSIRNLRGS